MANRPTFTGGQIAVCKAFYKLGMPVKDIAAREGISPAAVAMRLMRARRFIAGCRDPNALAYIHRECTGRRRRPKALSLFPRPVPQAAAR